MQPKFSPETIVVLENFKELKTKYKAKVCWACGLDYKKGNYKVCKQCGHLFRTPTCWNC